MKKLLKIRLVKLERALVAQQLEMAGKELFTPSEHVVLSGFGIDFTDDAVWLSRLYDLNIGARLFHHNDERDRYLNKVVKWISEEQFATGGKLEVGKKCEASDDNEDWVRRIFAGEADEQFGEPRFLALGLESTLMLRRWRYVRPLASSVRPKIDGDVYTWKTEVA